VFDDAHSVWELVERRAEASPDRVMLHDGDRTTTFAQYRDLVGRAAAGWAGLGVGPDVAVSWQLPTWTESAVLVGALCRLGARQNPMLPIYRHKEVAFIARQTACALLVTPSEWNGFDYAGLADQVASELDPPPRTLVADRHNPEADPDSVPARTADSADPADDPVRWIFYTSGTTTDPKGAQHTDRTVIAGAAGFARRVHVTGDDIALVAFPFTHVGGVIIGVLTPLLTGSAAVLMEAFTPERATELIRRHRITLGNGTPAIHSLLLAAARNEPDAYASVRAFPSGGSTKPPQLHFDLLEAVPSSAGIVSGYGMTEAPILSQTDVDASDDAKRDGEGTPTDGVVMKLVDREGVEVPPDVGGDAEGEIVVTGPQVMRGYLDASLDAATFTPDGFLRTGDLGRFGKHGEVVITGRVKDIIIRRGENISAKEVEDVLYGHPDVADVAVVGIPHAETGEQAVAFIVPRSTGAPPDLASVAEFCTAAGLMTQKIPERIEILDVMPRNPSGKVPKHELRALIGAQ
jgi:acyl-CoA synthetase (AMP-forming)/AMP-acid ligase II